MCMNGFCKGLLLGIGMGIAAEWLMMPHPRSRHTSVGKAMEKMGNAVDSALENISDYMR